MTLLYLQTTLNPVNQGKNKFILNDFDLIKCTSPNDVDSHYGTFLYTKRNKRKQINLKKLRTKDQKESATQKVQFK